MEAKNLRIGNYYYQDGFYRIERNKPRIYIPTRNFILNKETLIWLLTEGELDYIKPIKLTEEWLINFGLIETHYGEYILTNNYWGIYFYYDKDEEYWFVNANNEYAICKFKYVHELQNLFFALTGNELEFKHKL